MSLHLSLRARTGCARALRHDAMSNFIGARNAAMRINHQSSIPPTVGSPCRRHSDINLQSSISSFNPQSRFLTLREKRFSSSHHPSPRAISGISPRIDYRFRKTQKAVIFARENLRADRLVADEAFVSYKPILYNRIKQTIFAAADYR